MLQDKQELLAIVLLEDMKESIVNVVEEQDGSTESPEYNGPDAGYQDYEVALRFEDHVHKNALYMK